jgi:hypothetical protein
MCLSVVTTLDNLDNLPGCDDFDLRNDLTPYLAKVWSLIICFLLKWLLNFHVYLLQITADFS